MHVRAFLRRGSVDGGGPLKLPVVIAAHDEVESVGETVTATAAELEAANIDDEIVVVDDASGDGPAEVIHAISAESPHLLPRPGAGL
jgi:glycosyltransferase involved in cell wall biosynthesis